ncbi:MAG: uncharacterized LabA/DUF88 family protein [Cellvibrionaceae bacterium]|jgi:uncharacterized LabA/DUF88 family protein
MKKIALFADVKNIYYTARQAYNRQLNYRKLRQCISDEGDIFLANTYVIHRSNDK